jgi:hypothetical protein
MDPLLIISLILNIIAIPTIIFMAFIIRGALTNNQDMLEDYHRKDLSGTQREEIRRRLIVGGKGAVGAHEILDLIYTFRSVELGQYNDEDPYVPSDPYDDIDAYNS